MEGEDIGYDFEGKDLKNKKIFLAISGLLLVIMFIVIGVLGNIAMLICGALGLSGHLDINFGGAIAMVVIGSIFGGLPFASFVLN